MRDINSVHINPIETQSIDVLIQEHHTLLLWNLLRLISFFDPAAQKNFVEYSSDRMFTSIYALTMIGTILEHYDYLIPNTLKELVEHYNSLELTDQYGNPVDEVSPDYVLDRIETESMQKSLTDIIMTLAIYCGNNSKALHSFFSSDNLTLSTKFLEQTNKSLKKIKDLYRIKGTRNISSSSSNDIERNIDASIEVLLVLMMQTALNKGRSVDEYEAYPTNHKLYSIKYESMFGTDAEQHEKIMSRIEYAKDKVRNELPSFIEYQIENLLPVESSVINQIARLFRILENVITASNAAGSENITESTDLILTELEACFDDLINRQDTNSIVTVLKSLNKSVVTLPEYYQLAISEIVNRLLMELLKILDDKTRNTENLIELKKFESVIKNFSSDKFHKVFPNLTRYVDNEFFKLSIIIEMSMYREPVQIIKNDPEAQIKSSNRQIETGNLNKVKLQLIPDRFNIQGKYSSVIQIIESESQLREVLSGLLLEESLLKEVEVLEKHNLSAS